MPESKTTEEPDTEAPAVTGCASWFVVLFEVVLGLLAYLALSNFWATLSLTREVAVRGVDATATVLEVSSVTHRRSGPDWVEHRAKLSYDGHTKWLSRKLETGQQVAVAYTEGLPDHLVFGRRSEGFWSLLNSNLRVTGWIKLVAGLISGVLCLVLVAGEIALLFTKRSQ